MIEGTKLPTIEGSPRSRALWQAWSRLAGVEDKRLTEPVIVAI